MFIFEMVYEYTMFLCAGSLKKMITIKLIIKSITELKESLSIK